ncbi:MAG TPA: hypothetical protein ENN60_03730 [archaeon]|nr:hypothetical protein [archaeon]
MIVETLFLSICIYGIARSGNTLKIAAFISFLAYPALLLLTKAGEADLVLLLLAFETVPLAFALLLAKVHGKLDFRRLWKHA